MKLNTVKTKNSRKKRKCISEWDRRFDINIAVSFPHTEIRYLVRAFGSLKTEIQQL